MYHKNLLWNSIRNNGEHVSTYYIKITSKPKNTSLNMIHNAKDRTDSKPGVYKLKCSDSNNIYKFTNNILSDIL